MSVQRIRTIKPEFFVHEDLADVTMPGRLLFVGLWTVADRDGRLEDRPRRLKAQLFPHDAVDLDLLLEELAGRGFIRRYVIEGHAYIDIPAFPKHQRVGNREPASEIPPCPPTHVARAYFSTLQQDQARARPREREREREGVSLAPLALVTPPRDRFDEFWSAYPKKRHKPDARKAWTRAQGDGKTDTVLAGVTRWTASDAWQRGFIEDPATFLRQRQWEDEPPVGTHADTNAAQVARLRAKLTTREGT